MDLWEEPNRINEEPYFGWLQTKVPTYGYFKYQNNCD